MYFKPSPVNDRPIAAPKESSLPVSIFFRQIIIRNIGLLFSIYTRLIFNGSAYLVQQQTRVHMRLVPIRGEHVERLRKRVRKNGRGRWRWRWREPLRHPGNYGGRKWQDRCALHPRSKSQCPTARRRLSAWVSVTSGQFRVVKLRQSSNRNPNSTQIHRYNHTYVEYLPDTYIHRYVEYGKMNDRRLAWLVSHPAIVCRPVCKDLNT